MRQVAAAQSQIAYSNGRIAATVEYAGPLLFAAFLQSNVRNGLQQLVADEAAGQVDDMVRQRARAAHLSVLPWHGERRRARAALLHYLDGRVSYLRAVARDSNLLYSENPELRALFERLRATLRAAAGAGRRVEVETALAGGTHPTA
jgi:hypothetical protein